MFSSVIVSHDDQNIERDETHYFLIPYILSETGYALYTQRVLPDGIGLENHLPKARLFHIPTEESIQLLEKLLQAEIAKRNLQTLDQKTPLADRLDLIAKEIDQQSNRMTGGLLLAGGLLAIVNPVAGITIISKGLVPKLGTTLSKHGINHVTNWLRNKKSNSLVKKAQLQATNEINQLDPEVIFDPVIAILETSLSTKNVAYDPNIEFAELMNTPQQASSSVLSSKAISSVYEDYLSTADLSKNAQLNKSTVNLLKSISELAEM